VLVADDGAIVGRFNLVFVEEGVAEVGYRVAQRVAGQGVATAGLRELCLLAASCHRVRTLRAATSSENLASQKGVAESRVHPHRTRGSIRDRGKEGSWYQRNLTDESE
jgi:[ribosomal protein S5]-alanine N-acetyltransferase